MLRELAKRLNGEQQRALEMLIAAKLRCEDAGIDVDIAGLLVERVKPRLKIIQGDRK